ncbi:hypothetical protein TIFTF001_032672 [Ficus carica]|uniref:Uncharacterized protein n=1 Tax=Ficus carica TaxID=3494 RepID=A0AA88J645_FICCA|nr:hypothetical protein TIFTF001_032672 [Ficus carica]
MPEASKGPALAGSSNDRMTPERSAPNTAGSDVIHTSLVDTKIFDVLPIWLGACSGGKLLPSEIGSGPIGHLEHFFAASLRASSSSSLLSNFLFSSRKIKEYPKVAWQEITWPEMTWA